MPLPCSVVPLIELQKLFSAYVEKFFTEDTLKKPALKGLNINLKAENLAFLLPDGSMLTAESFHLVPRITDTTHWCDDECME